MNPQITILLLLALLFGCSNQKKKNPVNFYYYELVDEVNSDQSRYVISFVDSLLPNGGYIITYQSQYSWPFYQTFTLDEYILKKDILPPHIYTHRFLPIADYSKHIAGRKFKLQINYTLDKNNRVNLDMTSFKSKDGTKWSKHVHLGLFVIPAIYSESDRQLAQRVSETIIRYSFK